MFRSINNEKQLIDQFHNMTCGISFTKPNVKMYRSSPPPPLYLNLRTRQGCSLGSHILPYIKCTTTRARVANEYFLTLTWLRFLYCIIHAFLDLQTGLNITSIWDQGSICFPGLPFGKRKLRFYNGFIALWMSCLPVRSNFTFLS